MTITFEKSIVELYDIINIFMKSINLPLKKNITIMALGAESAGVFAFYNNGKIFISENFGDLLDENNFSRYKKAVLNYLIKEKNKPKVIISDLHPLFKTTIFGSELAKKYNTCFIKVQHHIAHVFSSIADFALNAEYGMPDSFYGIAIDGTGYGLDENIWGGEIFRIISSRSIERIGSLEEQVMIGGDLAVREPARMLIGILNKFLTKEDIYHFIKKHYSKNEFEALHNQLEQDFNCQKTTSSGRILDAVAVLLGFAGNERNYKHEAVKKLEANSGKPYDDIDLRFSAKGGSAAEGKIYDLRIILDTTHLFEYLIKNIHKDKRRLAATAQVYISKGLYGIIKKNHKSSIINHKSCVFAAGGMANNKIISEYLNKKGVYLSKKIPRGDEGIAVGQIIYHLLSSL